ncbi:hypothetical protein N8J89_25735 [Crossiella sp. CA-258035]|nr:hypothetical protein [Crossiella sp. CA-258035]WHT16528.1 hypothetical protein N8J89_25735 [Crossiella sp. CA-258035]
MDYSIGELAERQAVGLPQPDLAATVRDRVSPALDWAIRALRSTPDYARG